VRGADREEAQQAGERPGGGELRDREGEDTAGDGINDAPALAADLILLRDDLRAAADAIRLARATFRTIRRNLTWAFGSNVVALPVAALGFLNPSSPRRR
jgi:cation transport ATPase